jgi:hypothetical protein
MSDNEVVGVDGAEAVGYEEESVELEEDSVEYEQEVVEFEPVTILREGSPSMCF